MLPEPRVDGILDSFLHHRGRGARSPHRRDAVASSGERVVGSFGGHDEDYSAKGARKVNQFGPAAIILPPARFTSLRVRSNPGGAY